MIFKILKIKWLLMILCLLPQAINAQYHPTIRTGRPGQDIGPFTVGSGIFQIQTGLNYGKSDVRGSANKSSSIAENTVFRFGLTETFEVSTALTVQRDKFSSNDFKQVNKGLSQADLGFRVNIHQGTGIIPSVGFQSRLRLNVLSNEYNADNLGLVFVIITGQKLTKDLLLATNWGAVWNGNDPDPAGRYVINLSFPLKGDLGGFVENYGSVKGGDFDTRFDLGLAYLLNNDLQLDMSGGFGNNDGLKDYFMDIGLSWRFSTIPRE